MILSYMISAASVSHRRHQATHTHLYLLVKVRWPPGGQDELLQPRLLHPQRSLDVEEDNGAQDIERVCVQDNM